MIFFTLILLMINSVDSRIIFDFTNKSNIDVWSVVDDDVMGGKSSGLFYLSKKGHGVFEGNISLLNNGGFSFQV